MTTEELLIYKQKVDKLSACEKEKRDLYLIRLMNGEIEGPLTGFSSIDKPWLKFYRKTPIKEINPNQTMYDMVFGQENMDAEAIGYLGTVWTYHRLKEKVDRCADAFYKLGVGVGITVLVGVSNSPESIVSLLALNKLGAISKWFDLRASENDIMQYANSSECRYMISFDLLLSKVVSILDSTKLEKVIVISPVESASLIVKSLFNIKNRLGGKAVSLPKDQRYVKYSDFIRTGEVNSNLPCVGFDTNRATIMIQSSGTTGKPKTIVHSDYSITQCAREIAYSDLPLGPGKKLLVALPPWIAYGIGDAIILPLSLGTKVELCPDFAPNSVFKNVGKFTIAFAAPFHYRYLRENIERLSCRKKKQFEKVECLVSGGDKISVEENKEFEELFHTVLVNGYGNNEGWGALTVNPIQYNKYGTVGIPKYDEIIISYDMKNKKELQYGEIGEICSLANTQFLEYENNEAATRECRVLHDDNKVWLHTGDLGFIDDEGFCHLEGRARRVIVRLGFKISAYTIEDSISENECVKECIAVSVEDKEEEHVPMVYIVLKEKYKNDLGKIKRTIFEHCHKNLKEYEIPKYIQFIDELPYTQNGKYDFRALEDYGNKRIAGGESDDGKISISLEAVRKLRDKVQVTK